MLVEGEGIWKACYIEDRKQEEEDWGGGGFTHPNSREERAGGVTRTIQKVVSVQLQTHPPRIGQTEKAPKPAGKSHQDRKTDHQTEEQGKERTEHRRENPDCKEPVKR